MKNIGNKLLYAVGVLIIWSAAAAFGLELAKDVEAREAKEAAELKCLQECC